MTNEMTDERLAYMRETVADPDYWRELSMKDTREIALDLFDHIDVQQERIADLLAEVERLESSKLLAASMMAEQFCGEEVARLREQVETLQAEREGAVRWYMPAYREVSGGIWVAGTMTVLRECAEAQSAELNGDGSDDCEWFVATRLHLPWVPVTEEGPTP